MIKVVGAAVGVTTGAGVLPGATLTGAGVTAVDAHAENVRAAMDSNANNRFDVYILLELFPLQHVRCFRSSHLSFAVVNVSGQKARIMQQSGWA
jgi:hypothetical protein